MRNIIFLSLSCFLILACEQKGTIDSTKERARAEGEAGNDADNRNVAEKAVKMEIELTARHEFYSAIAGSFEGDVLVDKDTYKIKMILTKSLAPYTGSRSRQLSEIESDLNNLTLNVQIVQWHPADTATAVGCRVGNIRPNMDQGTVTVTAADCPNAYAIYLAPDSAKDLSGKEQNALDIANAIKAKTRAVVKSLVGTIQPTTNARQFTYVIRRSL